MALDIQEQLMLERICVDKDPEEALEFVLEHIAPKIKKELPCLSRELMRHE